ncbi:hypothetical protein K469DRAFT_42119 [Zopfia rhizophila CBS 207.26]|uniref:Uncharacterized protein n=1 Tax=Zopfia rhizophila CBS 207.26 TaxID=1314779 RepID=A0A6A6EEP2_9PEZI|nr:hypothetical protein K469DRAFT_42119 [Zopfia rhizophila CBS 207.26]
MGFSIVVHFVSYSVCLLNSTLTIRYFFRQFREQRVAFIPRTSYHLNPYPKQHFQRFPHPRLRGLIIQPAPTNS